MYMHVQRCTCFINKIFSAAQKRRSFRPITAALLTCLGDPPEAESAAIEFSIPELFPAVPACQPSRRLFRLLLAREPGKRKLRIPRLMNPHIIPEKIHHKLR